MLKNPEENKIINFPNFYWLSGLASKILREESSLFLITMQGLESLSSLAVPHHYRRKTDPCHKPFFRGGWSIQALGGLRVGECLGWEQFHWAAKEKPWAAGPEGHPPAKRESRVSWMGTVPMSCQGKACNHKRSISCHIQFTDFIHLGLLDQDWR